MELSNKHMKIWNEVNFILNEKVGSKTNEVIFERAVLEAFRIMEWSEYLGDLSVRQSFNIGASNRITPDILVKSDNKNLFVIEIKHPANKLVSRHKDQLASYLRFLKLEIGIIIGEKIMLIYDDKMLNSDDVFVFEEIEFFRDNPKGADFISLFHKNNYNPEQILMRVKEKIAEQEHSKSVQKLKTELFSSSTESRVKDFLKEEFNNKYEQSVIDNVFSDIRVSIIDKSEQMHVSNDEITKSYSIKNKEIVTSAEDEKIGVYVRKTFNEVIDKIDSKELNNLQQKEYCKATLDLQFPFLKKVDQNYSNKIHRYWKDPVTILGDKYVMCSEWYANDRPQYEAWLRSMRKK